MKSSKFILLLVILIVGCVCIFREITVNSRAIPGKADTSVEPDLAAEGGRGPDSGRIKSSKRSEERRVRHKAFSKHLHEAKMCFNERRIPAAFAALDRADAVIEGRCETLNLRGSCHVEMRQFDKALEDFKKAVEISKGNPSILFNIGEVYFVTKRWQESLDVFEGLGRQLTPENIRLGRLVDFKILLCNKQLGRNDEALAAAGKHDVHDNSPFHWYAKAALAFADGNPESAEEWLASASRKFPNPVDLAPWTDTLVEYGSIKRFGP